MTSADPLTAGVTAPETPGAGDAHQAAARPDVAGAARIVVKIGSSSLTRLDGSLDSARIAALATAIAGRVHAGHQVLLVSSGAIATGLAPLGLPKRPRDLAT